VVLVASVSARQCRTRVWSAVAAESSAMECTGMFGSAEMVSGVWAWRLRWQGEGVEGVMCCRHGCILLYRHI